MRLQLTKKDRHGCITKANLAGTGWHAVSATCLHCVLNKPIPAWAHLPHICISKLQHYASFMTATDAHAKLGKQFIKLSEQSYKD